MKSVKLLVISLGLLIGSSCTLNLLEDPNAVPLDKSQANLVLNSIQRQFALVFQQASTFGMQMTRLQNVGNAQYNTAVRPEGLNGLWTTAYAGVLMDCDRLIAKADADGYARHAGIARVLQAYTIILMVDYFGDIPFSEAFQGAGNLNPRPESGAELYELAITILNRAKKDLTTRLSNDPQQPGYLNPIAPAPQDLYYSNNYSKWLRFINTLKLKIHLQRRLIPDLVNAIRDSVNAIRDGIAPVGSGGIITAASENFIWRYGTNLSDPDSRHPRFVANYPGGGGNYMSNWLMWAMYHGYNMVDPRMRFYFYRQTIFNSTDPNEIRCLTETIPSHYPVTGNPTSPDGKIFPMGSDPAHPTNNPNHVAWSRTFCYPTPVGYWGRDHVDPQGIPPDGLRRTAWGIYPAGGRYDANNNLSVSSTVGMRGAGFQPIMMRSYVQFMLAESELFLNSDVTAAGNRLSAAITASFEDVRDWGVNGTYNTNSMPASTNFNPIPSGDITAYNAALPTYRTAALDAYSAAGNDQERMLYIAREAWIAYFGNGIEAYNLYRRTGMPWGMQPTLNPLPGKFPRSFWYPAAVANLNRNINQKPDLAQPVFWDRNNPPLNLDY